MSKERKQNHLFLWQEYWNTLYYHGQDSDDLQTKQLNWRQTELLMRDKNISQCRTVQNNVAKEIVNLMQGLSNLTIDLMMWIKTVYLHVFSDDKNWTNIFTADSIQLDKVLVAQFRHHLMMRRSNILFDDHSVIVYNLGLLNEVILTHGSLLHHLDCHVSCPLPLPLSHHTKLTTAKLLPQSQLRVINLPLTMRQTWNMICWRNLCTPELCNQLKFSLDHKE